MKSTLHDSANISLTRNSIANAAHPLDLGRDESGRTRRVRSTTVLCVRRGDSVVIFEPFYENYGPDSILSGAKPRFVSLRPPQRAGGEWTFDEQELREAFKHQTGQHQTHHSKTKAIILNTPNNPTGKVFS